MSDEKQPKTTKKRGLQSNPRRKKKVSLPKGQVWQQKTSRNTLVVFLILSFLLFLPLLSIFFIPLILATTFTTLIYPVYKGILKITGQRRKTSSFICLFLFFIGLLIPAYLIINLVIQQTLEVYASAEPAITDLLEHGRESDVVQYFEETLIGDFFRLLDIDWGEVIEEMVRQASSMVTVIINRTYAGVFGLFFNLLVMVFTMFYFLLDGKLILSRIKELIPIKFEYEEMIIERFNLISRATVLGTLIIGLAQGTAGGITLLLFGIETWLLWSFVMVILSIIPLVGAWLVLIPAAIIQLLFGNYWAAAGIFLSSTLIVSNLDNLIRPRVVGRGARIHDLMIFFSTLGGLSLFGVMGFIIGPAIASFFLTFLDIYKLEFKNKVESVKNI
ncbi:AI-2E family transporter [Chitinispirillales bacterium ANBcel5]|uniref:AI-2E family transporter n=1 Tax=Cellulosispirillum alkaliphilum TaxID=3039283 RepID=UPI002A560B91|nr:AI-2E family transporter [Chitinispirillales bacterium ANBcel5]